MGYNGKEGTYNGEPVFCPVNCHNESDCPYCKNGLCCMEDGDPMIDCDDMNIFFNDWEDWDTCGNDEDFSDEIDESHYDPFMGQDFFE